MFIFFRQRSSAGNLIRRTFWSKKEVVTTTDKNSAVDGQLKRKNEPFIKSLYAGKYINEYLIFPGLSSDESKELKHFTKPIIEYFNDKKQVKTNEKIKNFNLHSSLVPKAFNGLELDSISRAFVYEQMGKSTDLALNLLIHSEIITKALLFYGTNEQREKYLAKLSSGDLKGILCYKENNHTIDTINYETTVDTDMILNGRKTHVLMQDGDASKVLYLVIAKLINQNNEAIGLRSYFVDGNTPGVTRTQQSMNLSTIDFKNVELKEENQIGTNLSGHDMMKNLFESSYSFIAAIALGMLKDMYEVMASYTVENKQFDGQMYEFINVQEDLSLVETQIYALESMIYLTAGIYDSYIDADASVESMLTKIYSTLALTMTMNSFKNLLTNDYDVLKKDYFDSALTLSHFPIQNDLLKLDNVTQCLVGSSLHLLDKVQKLRTPLDNPEMILKTIKDRYKLTKYLNQDLAKSGKSYFYLWESTHPSLKTCCAYLEQSAIRLMIGVEQMLVDFGNTIVDNQIALRRLSDMSMEIYAMNASIARCSRSYSIGLQNSDHEIQLVTTLCYYANKRCEYLYNELITTRKGHNVDDLLLNIASRSLRDKQIATTHCLERSYD